MGSGHRRRAENVWDPQSAAALQGPSAPGRGWVLSRSQALQLLTRGAVAPPRLFCGASLWWEGDGAASGLSTLLPLSLQGGGEASQVLMPAAPSAAPGPSACWVLPWNLLVCSVLWAGPAPCPASLVLWGCAEPPPCCVNVLDVIKVKKLCLGGSVWGQGPGLESGQEGGRAPAHTHQALTGQAPALAV